MTYRVVYTETFHAGLETQLAWFQEQGAPEPRIARWLGELLDLVDSLSEFPDRFAVAQPESIVSGVEVRFVPFGDYLAFFVIDTDRCEVQLLSFRHGARRRDID